MNQRIPLYLLLLTFFVFSCGTENEPTYTLTTSVSPDGRGTISPSEGEFTEGEQITLTGNPTDDGWVFSRWEGDWNGTSNPVTITFDKNYNIIGVFERRDYPLNITIEGEGTLTETIVSQPTTDYSYETIVELTPNPSEGWSFVEWSGDLSGSQSPQQITIDGEKNVSVRFEPTVYLSENGVTIMCPNGKVGEIGIVDGVQFEVVDKSLLDQRRDEGSDLTKVCVSNVTDMSYMFRNSQFNQPIGNWDVSNVTDMNYMFRNSQFNQPIGNWDVGNVTDVSEMFYQSQFNQPIGDWDVRSVTKMTGMFYESQYNQPIGDWDVSNVTDMSYMFFLTQFNQPIDNWDVSSVTNMYKMFTYSPFNQPIGDWDVSNVTNMLGMFDDSSFNQPIENWDVSNVTDMRYMFRNSPFNQPINGWCVSQIPSEPLEFSLNSPLTEENKPIWGTCPD